MTPRALTLSRAARLDIARRARMLAQARDPLFAAAWVRDFIAWLRRHAESGAVMGTEHPRRPGARTFGYKSQATVVIEYPEGEVRVVRVYFAGQDWLR